MFNIGDEIVWLGTDNIHFTHNGIYKVYATSTIENVIYVTTNTGFNATTGYDPNYWEIVRKPNKIKLPAPKNDIEWLDRVQQNFKE